MGKQSSPVRSARCRNCKSSGGLGELDGIFYLQLSDVCTAQCVWRTVLCIDGMDYGFHAQLIYLVFAQKYLCEGI